MRFTFIAGAFCCTVSAAMAAPERTQVCEAMSDLAAGVMDSRQAGVAAPEALRNLTGGEDQQFSPIFTDLVVAAYSVPRFSTERNQQRAVVDFSSATWLECMSAR